MREIHLNRKNVTALLLLVLLLNLAPLKYTFFKTVALGLNVLIPGLVITLFLRGLFLEPNKTRLTDLLTVSVIASIALSLSLGLLISYSGLSLNSYRYALFLLLPLCLKVRETRLEMDINRSLLILLLLVLLYLATPHMLNTRVTISHHGALHSSIVYNIINSGIPPVNPGFAGEPIRYYWPFHVLTAVLVTAVNLAPVQVISTLNIISLELVLLLIWRITLRRYGSEEHGYAALILLFLGLGAVNPWSAALRQGLFEILTLNPLSHIFSGLFSSTPISYSSVVSTIGNLSNYDSFYQYSSLMWDGRLISFVQKFTAISGFPIGLLLFTFMLKEAFKPAFKSETLKYGLFALTGVLLFHLHTTTALFAFSSLAAARLFRLLDLENREASYNQFKKEAALWLVIGALCLPFFLHIQSIGTYSSSISLGLSASNFLNFAAIIPLTALAILSLNRSYNSFILEVSSLMLALLALFIILPDNNQYKSIFMLGLVLPIIGSKYFVKLFSDHRNISVLLILLMLPNFAIFTYSIYTSWDADNYRFEGSNTRLKQSSPYQPETMNWIQSNTSPNSRFVVDPAFYDQLGSDNLEDAFVFPLLTQRNMFVLSVDRYDTYQHYDSAASRKALSKKLLSCEKGLLDMTAVEETPQYVFIAKHSNQNCSLARKYTNHSGWSLVRESENASIYKNIG